MTFDGSFSLFALTARITVKPPHDKIGTVQLLVNSRVLVAGISNRMGVSSMYNDNTIFLLCSSKCVTVLKTLKTLLF